MSGQTLSTRQAGALVVASMVGTGVFTTSGFLLTELGARWAVLMVWAMAGLLALAGAAVYAELGAMMPRVGGEYVYLSRLHPAVGFLAGFVSMIVGFAAPMAAGADAFSRYLLAAWPGAPGKLVGYLLLLAVTGLHALEIRWAGRLQTWLTGLNLLAILVFIALGVTVLLAGGDAATVPVDAMPAAAASATGATTALASPSIGGFALGLVIVSYSYFGWNAAAYVAGELRDPGRSLPRVLLVGCGLVTLLYVALNAVLLALLPPEQAAGKLEIAHLAAARALGPAAGQIVSLVVALVLAASVSALAMTGARVILAMAEDGTFFRVFARRNRRGAPTAAALLQGALALILALSATFETLLVYVGFTLTISAGTTVAAAMILRRRHPELPRPYRTPGWPVVPLAYLALSAWMTVQAFVQRPLASLAGCATLVIGFALYRWRRP